MPNDNRKTPNLLNDAVWLREEYEVRGRDCRDIAREVGCAYSTVARALKRLGIQPRGLTPGMIARMQANRQVTEKRCTRCGEVKPREAFHISRTEASGLQTWCKDCQNKGGQEYRQRHPERIKAANRRAQERHGPAYYRANHQRLKRTVIDAYGGKCECCGETEIEFLSLDHADGGGNKHRKAAGGATRVWRNLRDAGWPRECEYGKLRVLCMNCQFATKHGRTCPHQLKKEAVP